jgi:hypothetical protein
MKLYEASIKAPSGLYECILRLYEGILRLYEGMTCETAA